MNKASFPVQRLLVSGYQQVPAKTTAQHHGKRMFTVCKILAGMCAHPSPSCSDSLTLACMQGALSAAPCHTRRQEQQRQHGVAKRFIKFIEHAVRCHTVAVRCRPVAAGCQLVAARCQPLTIGCQTVAATCQSITIGCQAVALASRLSIIGLSFFLHRQVPLVCRKKGKTPPLRLFELEPPSRRHYR